MLKKLFLVAALTSILMGCSGTSKKENLKPETSVAPKSVAVLLADRGTLNDVRGVSLFRENLVKESTKNSKAVKVQSGEKTVKLLDEKQGITVAGQLAGVEKEDLRKDLEVEGLVYVQVKKLGTTLKPTMENFKPAGAIVKSLEADVRVYNQGKLYKNISVVEESETKISLEEMTNLKNTITEVNSLVKNINSTNIKKLGSMPEFVKLQNRLKTYNTIERNRELAVIFETLPTEQLFNVFSDLFVKAGLIKGHVYQDVIENAAKKVQLS